MNPTLMQETDARAALFAQMHAARDLAHLLARTPSSDKDAVLVTLAEKLRGEAPSIIEANTQDCTSAQVMGYSAVMLDRLRLDERMIAGMAESLLKIASLKDPVGEVMAEWQEPNGLSIRRVRTPLGVIGVIYESRPNVTIDAAALCFKSGNPVILRGGKEALKTNTALCALFRKTLAESGLREECVQLVPSADRALVGEMLRAQGLIDVIVPRGGKTLVARVMEEARVPVFAHLEGIVHVFLHRSASPDMAEELVLNAKMRRTGICGAAECLLVDAEYDRQALKRLFSVLIDAGCTLHGDEECRGMDLRIIAATDEDWGREYLCPDLAVKIVADQQEAEQHIARFSSGHTEVMITEDTAAAERFFQNVDSAIVMHNASSQFADGGEFGMGAEIGISTGKMHARGPVGLEQLTSFQYHVRGNGALRA